MKDEEKELLVKDLSARLLYGVKVKVTLPWANDVEFASDIKIRTLNACLLDVVLDNDDPVVKPYLRPMESMTDIEKKELNNILKFQYYSDDSHMCESTDWLNANHFDYRGLIPMGLALKAKEEMYNLKLI